MNLRQHLNKVLAFGLLVCAWPCWAQDSGSTGRGGGVLTRHFKTIAQQENQLHQCQQSQVHAACTPLLSPVLSVQHANGQLDNVQALWASTTTSRAPELLQLHEIGGALVATLKSPDSKSGLIVDVWQSTDGSNWQLRLRILPPR